jgi:hypothetical protein
MWTMSDFEAAAFVVLVAGLSLVLWLITTVGIVVH